MTEAQKMLNNIEKTMNLISDEEAAALVENIAEVGQLASGLSDVFKLTYGTLTSARLVKNRDSSREIFAKAQLLSMSILQAAFALGIREGEKRAEEMETQAAMLRDGADNG